MTQYNLKHLPDCNVNNHLSANTFYVYGLLDPKNFELKYIGQTYDLKNRYFDHLSRRNLKKITYKANWIKSLVKNGLYPIMIILEIHHTFNDVKKAEEDLISYFSYIGCNLTNLTLGGDGRLGRAQTFQIRKKISKKLKKEKKDSVKDKVSYIKDREICNKREVTQHSRDIASKTHKGKIMSVDSRQKISNSLKGENHPYYGKSLSKEHILKQLNTKREKGDINLKLSFEIAEEIRHLYNSGNFTLTQLGKKYDVSYTTISKIINGHRYSRDLYLK